MKKADLMKNIAGAYHVKSPYIKGQLLPFNIKNDGYVYTVEYKGMTPYMVASYYTIESIHEMIEKEIIMQGCVPYPKGMKREEEL